MKIGVTGYKGRLGSALVKLGAEPLEGDIRGHDIARSIARVSPDVIIHCAAMTDVDGCENSPVEAASVNTYGTQQLIERFGGKLVYISTDYIFDGLVGPYSEDAYPNPLGVYGWSKLGGEIMTRRGGPNNLIVRTTMLFDATSRNFVTTVACKLQAGEQVFLPDNLYGSPTYIPPLAAALMEAASRLSGVINIVGLGGVPSRYEVGLLIAEALEVDPELVKATQIVPGAACRPLRAGLRTDKARQMDIPIYDYRDGISEVINALETVENG